jgi:hypothetical protein
MWKITYYILWQVQYVQQANASDMPIPKRVGTYIGLYIIYITMYTHIMTISDCCYQPSCILRRKKCRGTLLWKREPFIGQVDPAWATVRYQKEYVCKLNTLYHMNIWMILNHWVMNVFLLGVLEYLRFQLLDVAVDPSYVITEKATSWACVGSAL